MPYRAFLTELVMARVHRLTTCPWHPLTPQR
jgi:hypothetical protein